MEISSVGKVRSKKNLTRVKKMRGLEHRGARRLFSGNFTEEAMPSPRMGGGHESGTSSLYDKP